MMRLSKKNIAAISSDSISKPGENLFYLPEKILQFGTGVLLRGLCDCLVHEANTKGKFNGRIVVVKSTDSGGTDSFDADNVRKERQAIFLEMKREQCPEFFHSPIASQLPLYWK